MASLHKSKSIAIQRVAPAVAWFRHARLHRQRLPTGSLAATANLWTARSLVEFDPERRPLCSHTACNTRARAAEAASIPVAVLTVIAGCGLGFGYLALRKSRSDHNAGHEACVENIEPKDFKLVRTSCSGKSLTFAYRGDDPKWRGMCLRLRSKDSDGSLLAADAAAALRLAGGLTPKCELIRVDSCAVAALDDRLAHLRTLGGQQVFALRVTESPVPSQACEGPVVTVELRPGHGLADLYGSPLAFAMQSNSQLRRSELARSGKYDAHDLFSGRPERVSRALQALSRNPEDALRVLVDGVCTFPGPEGSNPAISEVAGFLGVVAAVLEGEGQALLMALLRAQCSAGAAASAQARHLADVLVQRVGHSALEEGSLMSPDALDIAFRRGFWTLEANESGKNTREREGERLLERARRELWVEGSASRRELETQVRAFLCLNLIGRAASDATLQFSIVKARSGSQNQTELRDRGFAPVGVATGSEFWCRLDLVDFEMPSEQELRV